MVRVILKYFSVILLFVINNLSSQVLPQENDPVFIQTMATCNKVVSTNNFVSSLSFDSSASLPIGLYKQIGQTTYIIAIDSARFFSQGANAQNVEVIYD